MKIPLPQTIQRLLHDAGYKAELWVERLDGRPTGDEGEAHLLGMMRAVEVDLEDAKERDS